MNAISEANRQLNSNYVSLNCDDSELDLLGFGQFRLYLTSNNGAE
jgi:hypothetical protein